MDNSGNDIETMVNDCIEKGISNINNKINVVMKQTNYDKLEAINKLMKMNYDEISVIKDYMGISNDKESSESNNLSTQQKIYKSFREFF